MLFISKRIWVGLLGSLILLAGAFAAGTQGSGRAIPVQAAPAARPGLPAAPLQGTPTPACFALWNIVSSANVGTNNNDLRGVATLSSTNVWAVGSVITGTPPNTVRDTLIEHWTGSAWTVVASPSPGSSANNLYAVSAVSTNDIWAVGNSDDGFNRPTLILHWDGTAWTQVPSPNVSTDNILYGVAAVAANDVWAVGYSSSPFQTLILHWNGTAWTQVSSINPGSINILNAVTVVAANDVWAVGGFVDGNGHLQTLMEHWNGTAWTQATNPSPQPGSITNSLTGVDAVTSNDIWAVGYYSNNATGPNKAMALHWDGTAWSNVTIPSVGSRDNFLQGVSAITANDVWAVGYYGNTYQTLIEHWNGSAWTVPNVPNPGPRDNALYGVSGDNANDVWAVGYTTNASSFHQTLTEQYTGACATSTASTTPANTATVTQTPTLTRTATQTVTGTPPTATHTETPTQTRTPTQTVTGTPPTATYTGTPVGGTTNTPTPTRTPTHTGTPTQTVTGTPPTATPTATVCPLQFTDVPVGSTFYDFVRCLACRGIVGGYPCGGPGEPCPGPYYRPNTNVTRGQVSKIVSESAGFTDPVPSSQWTFQDVPPGSTFALYVERIATRGIVGGYPCGGPFEPCVAPTNRPYFRPNNNVTRGQLSKITSGAAGWTETPTGQTFEDVPAAGTFYVYVERVATRGIVGGYPCGGAFEPCIAPGNRPYFRPNNNATRGQMAKIAAAAFFPNCQTPARR